MSTTSRRALRRLHGAAPWIGGAGRAGRRDAGREGARDGAVRGGARRADRAAGGRADRRDRQRLHAFSAGRGGAGGGGAGGGALHRWRAGNRAADRGADRRAGLAGAAPVHRAVFTRLGAAERALEPALARYGMGWWRRCKGALGPFTSVTPDLFRGPLCGEGTAGGLEHPPAARWTPEQVRGDGDFWAGPPPPLGQNAQPFDHPDLFYPLATPPRARYTSIP